MERPDYRLPLAPWSNLVAIVFFAGVIVSMAFDTEGIGRQTLYMFVGVAVAMVIGWFAVRNRIDPDLMDSMLDEDIEELPKE